MRGFGITGEILAEMLTISRKKNSLCLVATRVLAASAFAGWLPPPLKLRRDQPSLRLRLGKQDGATSWGNESDVR
jgi:hypothetical protein